ncbi:MAG: hypothetical protein EXS63_01925 [Candidatus Omnitrophica bacterium]|nr:hypothetical protein [Candidatus Omnitrophota bacterium]
MNRRDRREIRTAIRILPGRKITGEAILGAADETIEIVAADLKIVVAVAEEVQARARAKLARDKGIRGIHAIHGTGIPITTGIAVQAPQGTGVVMIVEEEEGLLRATVAEIASMDHRVGAAAVIVTPRDLVHPLYPEKNANFLWEQ